MKIGCAKIISRLARLPREHRDILLLLVRKAAVMRIMGQFEKRGQWSVGSACTSTRRRHPEAPRFLQRGEGSHSGQWSVVSWLSRNRPSA